MSHQITRRAFLGTTAAGGAAMFSAHLEPLLKVASAASAAELNEATIPQLPAAMTDGSLTSRDLTQQAFKGKAHLNQRRIF